MKKATRDVAKLAEFFDVNKACRVAVNLPTLQCLIFLHFKFHVKKRQKSLLLASLNENLSIKVFSHLHQLLSLCNFELAFLTFGTIAGSYDLTSDFYKENYEKM